MKPKDLYHTGLVVEDIDATMRWFTEVAGYEWCDQFAGEQVVQLPSGERKVQFRGVYSLSEPRLELVGTVPDTLWQPTNAGVHHLGYWSDDVDGDVATLAANGVQLEAWSLLPNGSSLWAYCRAASGTRVELVSRVLEPAMSAWWTAGRKG
jgi:hypothetical protein